MPFRIFDLDLQGSEPKFACFQKFKFAKNAQNSRKWVKMSIQNVSEKLTPPSKFLEKWLLFQN